MEFSKGKWSKKENLSEIKAIRIYFFGEVNFVLLENLKEAEI